MTRSIKIISVFLMALMIVGFSPRAEAVPSILADGNSTLVIEDNGPFAGPPPPGIQSWIVDGVEHMGAGVFGGGLGSHWYYATSYTGGDEIPLGNFSLGPPPLAPLVGPLPGPSVGLTDTNFDGILDNYHATYSDTILRFDVNIGLTGVTPMSDIETVVKITNLSGEAVSLDLYEHLDLNLGGTPGNDIGMMVDAHTYVQTDPLYYFEKVITHAPPAIFHYEIGPVGSIHGQLNGDGGLISAGFGDGILNLNSFPPIGVPFGGAGMDIEAAWQWSLTIPGSGSAEIGYLLSQDAVLSIVPEPSTYILLGSTLMIGICLKRRREKERAKAKA